MTTTFLSYRSLPPVLAAYAMGVTHSLPTGAFTPPEVRLAVWLRKGFLRRAQHDQPGIQYIYPDYERLMRGEITAFAKRTMEKSAFERFDELLENSLRLRALFTHELSVRCRNHPTLTPAKQRHLTNEAKRATFRAGMHDPRTLGEMEQFLLGRIHYGMPHGRNYQTGDDTN